MLIFIKIFIIIIIIIVVERVNCIYLFINLSFFPSLDLRKKDNWFVTHLKFYTREL